MKPQNSATAGPRHRGPLARLRDARIRTKLGLILIVPIAALIALAAVQLVVTGGDVLQARDAIRYAQLADQAATLGDDLQAERTLTAVLLTTPKASQDKASAAYATQTVTTDRQVSAYQSARKRLGTPTASVGALLTRIDTELHALPNLRRAVRARDVIPLSAAVFSYRSVVADLLAYRQTLANIAGSVDAANVARAASAIASHTEAVSQEQEAGIVILAGAGDVTAAQHEAFQATLEGQAEALRAFSDAVGTGQVTSMEHTLAGKDPAGDVGGESTAQVQKDIVAAQRFEGDVSRAPAGSAVTLSGGADPAQWTKTMDTQVDLSRAVEKRLDQQFRALVQSQESSLLRQVVAESVAVTLLVLIAIAIALLTARGMARSLRRLRVGALSVAYQSLPEAVARLRNPTTLGTLTPDDVVAGVRDVVPMTGHDEIGQVSEAFNVVYREAVRIAAEQAALRGSVSTMFTNLARRSQLMVDRLIGRLDKVERGEEDPDRLGQLFELDHLATQMRRNDENLLVLAGAESSRARRESAPLGDVLRAAQSQVDQYTRIDLGSVDMEVRVVGPAVNDLVHLIAELLDNATAFSSPDTPVTAEATWIGGRAFVTISDHGVGIAPEHLAELNQRLADPPPVDAALSRTMGLVVVGRLAERLGAAVELRSPSTCSTMAEVTIPPSILEVRQRPKGLETSPARVRGVMAPGRLDMATRWPAARFDRRPSTQPPTEPPAPPAQPSFAPPPPPARPPVQALPPRTPRASMPPAPPVPPAPPERFPVRPVQPQRPAALDDTADIPLFREVNSAWFRGEDEPGEGPARPSRPSVTGGWQTAADDGWSAASAASTYDEPVSGTGAGLPRRQPMARLVPGGVTDPQPTPVRNPRKADEVRGMLSSYHRGLQRGRNAGTEN
jgi:signal transduction histidine kinase